jgi:hypothetical protein
MLLEAPTGSGKTLMLGRALESAAGSTAMPTVWFWFAPYSGLVAQSRDALAEQCPRLGLRDLMTDRETSARDGDVFLQTWATVAANNREARRVRRDDEVRSLDAMLATLRADGYLIGIVIDEAHLNFGASAGVAARFYLDVLQPDLTLLATATPNDAKLEAFEAAAAVSVETRVVVDRGSVVSEGLNKLGLMTGILRFNPGDEELIDPEQAVLTAAWAQHRQVAERLRERGLGLTPLMLVQVEDQATGGDDPISRVRQKLEDAGVPSLAIAVHTSGQPDPEFHTLAYDDSKQVLIFKVAVATGFDAPRAWTLVSVRPNRGVDFGLQIVGRIMRVHPLVRPFHGQDEMLDRGYVFLSDPEMQVGLREAAETLRSVRQSLSLLTDRLDIQEFGTPAVGDVPKEYAAGLAVNELDRAQRLETLIQEGLVFESVRDRDMDSMDRAILLGERMRATHATPLFGPLPQQLAPGAVSRQPASLPGRFVGYRLNAALGLPRALVRELPLAPHEFNGEAFLRDVARRFASHPPLLPLIQSNSRRATLSLTDLFVEATQRELGVTVRLSEARVAERAQEAFRFNDSIDPRLLKPMIVEELRAQAEAANIFPNEKDLRRTVELGSMLYPDVLKSAVKESQGIRVRLADADPIPDPFQDQDGAHPALKGAHGIFPWNMNGPERRFAELVDKDDSGLVLWWLRLPENALWSTNLMLPTGRRFFPDFAVGVQGRSTPGGIALVEIKDDGMSGRLNSDDNLGKIKVEHREYRNVFWLYEAAGTWERARYIPDLNRIQGMSRFQVGDMVLLT